nr:uncharacterized protein LOC109160522 [Ipomoea batatas]
MGQLIHVNGHGSTRRGGDDEDGFPGGALLQLRTSPTKSSEARRKNNSNPEPAGTASRRRGSNDDRATIFSSSEGSDNVYSKVDNDVENGQEVLRAGVARRVGDGKDTNVWGCPWLADGADPFIRTHCRAELANTRVCNLLDNMGKWDSELLSDIFDPYDVPRILKTPISTDFADIWY